jgi:exodeoxyribonuclease VII small subunit
MKKTEAKTEAQNKNFEAGLAALEKIVRQLERGDLPLEESLKLFEEGVRLSRECQERLSQAERRIEVLLSDTEGRPVLGAFEEDAGALDVSGRATGEAEGDESIF